MLLQVPVTQGRRLARGEPISHPSDQVSPAPGGVEEAGAIAESAIGCGQISESVFPEIEHFEGQDGFRDFLPVGAYILHRRSAYAAGNPAQALDAATALRHRVGDETVPIDPGTDLKNQLIVARTFVDSTDAHRDHQSLPSAVRDDEVAPAAEHE